MLASILESHALSDVALARGHEHSIGRLDFERVGTQGSRHHTQLRLPRGCRVHGRAGVSHVKRVAPDLTNGAARQMVTRVPSPWTMPRTLFISRLMRSYVCLSVLCFHEMTLLRVNYA